MTVMTQLQQRHEFGQQPQPSTSSLDCDDPRSLPIRTLVPLDSMSTVSALSIDPVWDECPIIPGRRVSIPRLNAMERFKAPAKSDRGLPAAPGRKQSLHSIGETPNDMNTDTSRSAPRIPSRQDTADRDCFFRDSSTAAPPRLPSRQDTADRKNVFADAASVDNDQPLRPGLCRVAGGIGSLFANQLAPGDDEKDIDHHRPGLNRASGGLHLDTTAV